MMSSLLFDFVICILDFNVLYSTEISNPKHEVVTKVLCLICLCCRQERKFHGWHQELLYESRVIRELLSRYSVVGLG